MATSAETLIIGHPSVISSRANPRTQLDLLAPLWTRDDPVVASNVSISFGWPLARPLNVPPAYSQQPVGQPDGGHWCGLGRLQVGKILIFFSSLELSDSLQLQ